MQTLWFSNLPKSEQDSFKELVLGSHKVLDRALEILYNRVKDVEVVSTPDYDNSSWAYKQAHENGKREAYRDIIKLLTLSSTKD